MSALFGRANGAPIESLKPLDDEFGGEGFRTGSGLQRDPAVGDPNYSGGTPSIVTAAAKRIPTGDKKQATTPWYSGFMDPKNAQAAKEAGEKAEARALAGMAGNSAVSANALGASMQGLPGGAGTMPIQLMDQADIISFLTRANGG